MGYWTRANAEICLIATKGNIKRVSKAVHQIIMSPIQEHSKKPEETRDRIVQLIGDLPRIELFARQHADGWDCWRRRMLKRKEHQQMTNAEKYLKDGVIYHELACEIAVYMSNSIKKRNSTKYRRFFQTTSKASTNRK